MTDRLLVLVRHGQSEWNLANRFTGRSDVDLTATGVTEAREAGRRLKTRDIRFDAGFTSTLRRARRTLDLILAAMDQAGIPVITDARLDERDYGALTGRDKDDARRQWGVEQVNRWRLSYDVPPPGGESLADVSARVLPCYRQDILPRVLRGERILVAAHEHSLRALVMVLETLDSTQILDRELATGVPVIYRLNADATVADVRSLVA